MSLGPGLVNVSLLAEGFPHDICPAEVVAEIFKDKTKASVTRIAPLSDSSSGWLLLLQSHDDQIRCLMNYKTFDISYRNENYRITLNYPEVTLTSYSLNWITVMEDQQRQMDSATSGSMSGDGNRSYPEAQPNKRGGQGFPGVPPICPQQMTSHPQPGPQGFAQNTWKGQEQYHHPTPSMEQMSFPPPSQNMSFRQSGHQPVNNPYGSNPNTPTAGLESGRPPYPDLPNQEWSMVSQSAFGQDYPLSHSGGSVTPSLPQHQIFNAPGRTDSRPMQMTSPSQTEEGSEPLHNKMEDLNLRHDEPFPYYPSHDQPSMDPFGPNRDRPMATSDDAFFQSDFVVLSDVPGEDRSIQHPHVHLLVTDLPPSITESELRKFFEDRRQSGGGLITKVELNASARSAAIFFSDVQVIQGVLHKSPLLLNNKMIHVERSSAAKSQPAEPEVKTVEIRGLESEDDIEMCTYYFENPTKGGGDIESHEWNKQERILYITFNDPEVAKTVSTKGHKLGKGKVLEVSLYTPPVEKAEESPPPQCTVEVRGFDPEETELYDIYFSNPKKGGDTVVDLSLSEDKTVMLITFETPEVAQRVAEMPHKVRGRRLDVIVAPVEDPTPPCTVLVLGCDLEKEETYYYYFLNPKKGGGDIVDLVVDRDQQAILITFQDPEVAQTVVARQHKVGGRNLEVSPYKPKKASAKRQKSQEPSGEEEAAAPSRTVLVSMGPNPLQSEDTYILYFESSRHGGGEVESVQFDKGNQLVYITFTDPAVAEKVAGKTHTIVGDSAQVTLYVPPKPKPMYPDKLLFQNVADSTTRDCLSMYLERITGMEPLDILYGDEVGTVLVTFPREPDFPQTHQMTRERQLEKRQLTVSRVPISNCLLVENLADKTTEDTVHLYFENKRSRGGPVEKVDMIPADNKCLVYFESHEVLDGVLSQEHSLDGRPLKVKRYMECLGQSGGSDDPTAFTMPHPLILDQLDCFKVAFLRQSQTTKSEFLKQLSSSYADGRFERDTLIISCTLTPEVAKARIQARTWSVDVQQMVTQFLTLLEVKSHKVMQQLWTEVDQAVRGAGISYPDGATLFPVAEDTTYVVVGMKSMASQLYDQLTAVISAKEEEIERRKQQVTETISKLETSQLSLLRAVDFHGEAGKRHGGLKVDIQKKKCIVFHGLLKDVKEAQVEMYQVLQTMKTSKITNMTDLQIKLLGNKETKQYFINKFKNDNTSAVWEFSNQGEINVFAFDDQSLVHAIHLMNKSVVEHACQLSPESRELLRHQDWQRLVSEMTKGNPGVVIIAPAHDGLQVFVTSTDDILQHVVEEVEKFFAENTVYSQTVSFSPSRQKLVHMKWLSKLQGIGKNLCAYKVRIDMPEPGDKVLIQGTRKGLEEVMKHLETLNRQILCHAEEFEDPSKVKLLSSDCRQDLIRIGRFSQCVLSLQPEDPQLQVMGSSFMAPAGNIQVGSGDIQTSASAQLPNGVTVAVVHGDITQMAVGAIVNAANTEMNHIGGLAQDIVKKGGDSIQKECHEKLRGRKPLKEGEVLVSGPGRLRCQLIIHAVGPMYKGGYSGEQDCLFDTVMMCLRTANDSSLSSIAIPAISTGIFGYPAKESTKIISEAVKAYFDSQRRCTVKSVYLCHIAADIVGLFDAALRKTFQREQSAGGYERPAVKKAPSVPYYTPSSRAVAYSGYADTSSHRIINVSVIPGEIAKQSADVIINSTSNELDLQKGAVSASILKVAGQNLQMECKSKYPGGLQTGGLARTQGHGLNCQEIFHIVLCNYSHPIAQQCGQILRELVTKCLVEASGQHYTSLAFPVLGTGNLRFPAPVVAQTMLDAIHQFEQTTPTTTLRNVSIVVYPADQANLQEFQRAQSGTGRRFSGGQSFGTGATGSRQNRRFSEESGSGAAQSRRGGSGPGGTTHAVFDIGGLRFVIKQGDITDEDTDAIVNSTNNQLDLSRGGVASALKRKCGPQLEDECKRKVNQIQNEGVVITKAYGLKSQIIVHVNADSFSQNWEDGIELCFNIAEQNRVRSIAMPALGTGIGLAPSMSAHALLNTVVKMYKYGTRQGSLAEVRVVLFDKKMIPQFIEAVQAMGEKRNKSRKGFFSWVKSALTGNQAVELKQMVSNPVVETVSVSLFIYAESQPNVQDALRMLDEIAKEKFTRKKIQDEVIASFDDEDIRRVKQISQAHQTEVQIQTMTGQIICDGLTNQVFGCLQDITTMIREVEHKRQQKEAAEMLANMISWCYLEVTQTGTEQREYQPTENHIIETAYQRKKTYAEIKDAAGNVYIIDFNSMAEYSKDDPKDTVTVMRKDKIKDLAGGHVPENWAIHGPNETVKLVDLSTTDQEYQKVAQAFSITVPNVTVTTISRVQNPHLYHQYMAKKAHLEKQNAGVQNEKTLWHGTSSDAITNINLYGFNRSFCGKNATVHGDGVYFAINANYSATATYSPPDISGNRYIYYCKVLVGCPTVGQQNMRVLPPRSGDILFDSATDNHKRPSMYIIFNDTQAYPEYMITFQ
ncbi:hypothetical protein ACOMHN_059033 [Nucella lapillus]